MDAGFWHERWQLGEIGFHQAQVHPGLVRFFPALKLSPGARVLVPLCGKSLDLLWLCEQGFQVIGVELSQQAVEGFFRENQLQPEVEQVGSFHHYCWENLSLYCGDFFQLDVALLGRIDAVYDRAALVALPPAMRSDYAVQLQRILPAAAQILTISYDYLQQQMAGPPFAVLQDEIEQLFGPFCQLRQLDSEENLAKHLKLQQAGLTALREEVYQLRVRYQR